MRGRGVSNTLRIVSYNILDGGEGRADPLAEVLLAQRADIVVLIEADQLPVVERIAARLDMDFVHAQGQQHAAAILSRWPIRDSINHAAITDEISSSFAEATVVEHGGRNWSIGAVHLAPHAREENESQREKELSIVLNRFRGQILAGDFNSNSPTQEIKIEQTKPRTREDFKANGGHIPRRVIQQLLDRGFVDTLHAAHIDVAPTAGSFSTQFPGQRVDYIFAFGLDPGAIKDAWIERDRLAKYASDHYPVGAEIT